MYPLLTVAIDEIATITGTIAAQLRANGIELVGVTKAVDGEPVVAEALLRAGCSSLADSRLPAIARLATRNLGPITLIRSPQAHEIEAVARMADRVVLSDPGAARALGAVTRGHPLELLLGVDLGDRREGVLPEHVVHAAEQLAGLPGTGLVGIAVNFACLSGLLPTVALIRAAEELLQSLTGFCEPDPVLSLGGTCCVPFAGRYRPRVRTEVRSGVGVLMGWNLCAGTPLPRIRQVAPILTAVVLESGRKPPPPPGPRSLDAFGREPDVELPPAEAAYTLIALGRRDAAPEALRPLDTGVRVAGMTSDVAVLITDRVYQPGDTLDFAVDYQGLVLAVTSPFVTKRYVRRATPDRED